MSKAKWKVALKSLLTLRVPFHKKVLSSNPDNLLFHDLWLLESWQHSGVAGTSVTATLVYKEGTELIRDYIDVSESPSYHEVKWRKNSVLSDPGPVILFIPLSCSSQSWVFCFLLFCFYLEAKYSSWIYNIYIQRIILHIYVYII